VDLFSQGMAAYSAKNFAEAVQLWEQAAEEGDTSAMTNLGSLLMKGETGVARDPEKGREWLEKAYENGAKGGAFRLAGVYENGIGGPVDMEKALVLYREAAEKGHGGAMFRLATIRLDIPDEKYRDAGEGVRWMVAALDAGNDRAKMRLGIFDESILKVESGAPKNETFRGMDTEARKAEIAKILDSTVRAMLQKDGGDVRVLDVLEGEVMDVYLQYLGACSGCSLASTATLVMIRTALHENIEKNIRVFAL